MAVFETSGKVFPRSALKGCAVLRTALVFVVICLAFLASTVLVARAHADSGEVAPSVAAETVTLVAAEATDGDSPTTTGGSASGDSGSISDDQGSTLDDSGATADDSTSDADNAAAKQTVEQKLAKVNLSVRAKIQGSGWRKAVKSGKMAGTKTKKGLRMLKVKLTKLNGVSGSIRYKTYTPGAGWSKQARDGKASGSTKRAITALKVKLAGKVAKYYDVYYQVRVLGFGWLDWAKNFKQAGTTSTFSYITAVKIKLVKKGAKFEGATQMPFVKNRWRALEFKYRDDEDVNQILEVKHTGGSKAQVVLRQKQGTKWKTALSCAGYVGSAGIGAARENLARTPSGDFEITSAFGIKSDPGALMGYVQVTDAMYWCADRAYYNQLIDINEHPHECTGEHLIDYSPHYNYGLFFDYNTAPAVYGKGSAFFVHCTGGTPYTGGCVAVSQANMVKIIQMVEYCARICVYHK